VCRGKPEVQKKTTGTDVYAFGCLYYAVSLSIDPSARVDKARQIFFDSVPYEKDLLFRIGRLVTAGKRPPRLRTPNMQDSLWKLINDCWKFHASERPPMNQIVEVVKLFVTSAHVRFVAL
jgi:hypothetical protein